MEPNQTGIQKIVTKWGVNLTFFIYKVFIKYIKCKSKV